MIHDGKINIATGRMAGSLVWKNKTMLYSEFAARIKEAHYTNETYKEFMSASKAEQGKIKDVGGYVGGYLRAGKRSPQNVVHRQLATLDIDFAHLQFWDDFTLQFDCAALMHGTHKHSEVTPRYRLILPLSRPATPDEYVAVSRWVAGQLGIDLFDKTTFETNRLMFWPSSPKDVEYYFVEQEGAWMDVDWVLAQYSDWKDTSLWPTADKEVREIGDAAKKQEDPRSKKGIVGSWCRTYGIAEVIEKFLSEQYIPTSDDKRYTYTKGTTSAGLLVYEDTFAFSHHGTDPCSGKLSNAFDLVRVHLYGHLDEGSTTTAKPKSFAAMEDFALKDKEVRKVIAADNLNDAKYGYAEDYDDYEDVTSVEGDQDNIEWMAELESDAKGKYLSTSTNINTILAHDPRLKDTFKQNEFDGKRYVCKSLPWRKVTKPEPIKDVDYAGIRNYIESIYGITGAMKIDDSIALEFQKQSYHPVKDYLKALKWDGVKRIDSLLVDYFGTPNNAYTRESIRKMLVGSVARIFVPGIKFDLSMVLVGPQGCFKSTFIKILGGDWYSDTFMTVHGKEAFEQIQGVWLMEIAELSGFRKADAEAVKHFLTKQEDSFRAAYGRVTETLKRQTTFWPTSNKKEIFNDPTGNRRFMPNEVIFSDVLKSVIEDLPKERDQIWAEAVALFKQGEPLYLSTEADRIAKVERSSHSETDERLGLVEQYLEARLPKYWKERDIYERQNYLQQDTSEGEQRQFVCMAEIWCECLGKAKEDMSRYNTREINDIMKSLEGWEFKATTKNFGYYGKQKYYARRS
jgi:putative DNA primase/helicase